MTTGFIFEANKNNGKVAIENLVYKRDYEEKDHMEVYERMEVLVKKGFYGKAVAFAVTYDGADGCLWGYYDGNGDIEKFYTINQL